MDIRDSGIGLACIRLLIMKAAIDELGAYIDKSVDVFELS